MKIRMNDETVDLEERSTLADLCEHFRMDPKSLVIAVDGQVVPRGEYGRFVLKESATVELMVFVGGG